MMIEELQLLLDLFEGIVPDRASNRLVWSYCEEGQKWFNADNLFHELRNKNLDAERRKDKLLQHQYNFE